MGAILNFGEKKYSIKVRQSDNLLSKKFDKKDGLYILEVNQILAAILN
jgi:hypothetical protein